MEKTIKQTNDIMKLDKWKGLSLAFSNEKISRRQEKRFYSLEAERSCVGSVLINNKLFDRVFGNLKATDFYDERNRIVIESFHQLHRENKPLDLVTVTYDLQERGKLARIGGEDYLSFLLLSVPTTANVDHYVDLVHKQSIRRAMQALSEKISKELKSDKQNLQAIFAEAKSDFEMLSNVSNSLAPASDIAEGVDTVLEGIVGYGEQATDFSGIATGLPSLDDGLEGGLRNEELVVLGAKTSAGKTAFALTICYNNVFRPLLDLRDSHYVDIDKPRLESTLAGLPRIGVISLEMGRGELIKRFISMATRLPRRKWMPKVATGELEHLTKIFKQAKEKIYVVDNCRATKEGVLGAVNGLLARGIDFIVIDYLQLIRHGEKSQQTKNDFLGSITAELKEMARRWRIPILLLSQLNRASEPRSRPRLEHLRDSGAIEQDANIVLFLHRVSEGTNAKPEQIRGDIIIAKNRNGQLGTYNYEQVPGSFYFEESRVEAETYAEGEHDSGTLEDEDWEGGFDPYDGKARQYRD